MPGDSGIDVLRDIMTNHPSTAVIMLTVTADPETAIQTMKMGACDYLIKPVNLTELPRRVRRALDLRSFHLKDEAYRAGLEKTVSRQDEQLHASQVHALQALALALEAKDPYTHGHSQRVANLAVAVAEEIGLSAEDQEKLKFAALVHDIGKIGIREAVINKEKGLTEEEFQHITTHAALGEKILAPVIDDTEILNMVRHHHERYDGTGYPDGLAGDKIIYGARILAVADTYDAMTSDRPYRIAVSHEIAARELARQAGIQLDPDIVAAFLSCFENTQRCDEAEIQVA
jgi:putative two-component system response regulator